MRKSLCIPLLVLVIAGGMLAACGGEESSPAVPGTPVATEPFLGTAAMAVDAVPGGAVDASRVVTGSDPFEVDIVMVSVDLGYQGYQYKLEWDPSVLAYDDQRHLMPVELTFCADPVFLGESDVYTGCARAGGDTTYVGALNTVTLHCVASGESPLRLKSMVEDPNFGTSAIGDMGWLVETALADASVTCQ